MSGLMTAELLANCSGRTVSGRGMPWPRPATPASDCRAYGPQHTRNIRCSSKIYKYVYTIILTIAFNSVIPF